jgi:peptidoglycan/LPS O-acetylase OafA/YrhL
MTSARLPALDGLRGVAILLVVAHMLGTLDAPAGALVTALSAGFATGWIGVQLFFALSGFLITGILLDTRDATNPLSAFFARRFLRIFPLYYGTLFVAFVVVPALGAAPPTLAHDRAHQLWLWAYLENWVASTDAGSRTFPHFWSLCLEEQFYLAWPFVLRGREPRGCLRLCLGVGLAALGARLALLAAGVSHGAVYTFSVTRMDALALGGAAAAALRIPALAARVLARRRRLWGASLVVFVAGALATRGYALATFGGASLGYSFLSVTCALSVLAAAASDLHGAATPVAWSPLRTAPLRALGTYSYGIYVFHKPLHDLVGKRVLARYGLDATRSPATACVYVLAGLVVSFAAAFVSYHVYEKPFLALKSRFVPRLAAAGSLD